MLFIAIKLNVYSQTTPITFEDPNFKTALLNYDSGIIDVNNDSEISFDEAKTITKLIIEDENIFSIQGIEHFENIVSLKLEAGHINTIDFSGNTLLKSLTIQNLFNEINLSQNILLQSLFLIGPSTTETLVPTSLDLSNNQNLITVSVYRYANLTSINAPDLTSLKNLNTWDNRSLTNVNILGSSSLESLWINNAILLDQIDLSTQNMLRELELRGSSLTRIDLSNQTNLEDLDLNNSKFTELDLRACPLQSLAASQNSYLETIFMSGEFIEYTEISNRWSVAVADNPNLKYVCIEEEFTENIRESLSYSTSNYTEVFNDCSYFEDPAFLYFRGQVNSDWNEAENWNKNKVPTIDDDVIIPAGLTNYPTASSAVTFNSLTIETGATFKPESTVTGPVTYTIDIPNTNWHMIASPVSGDTYENIIANTDLATGSGTNVGLAPYNPATSSWNYQTTSSTGTIPVGQGMTTKLVNAGELSFTGTVITEDFTYPVTQGAFNLIGNPYTSYINSTTFFNNNSDMLSQPTIWIHDGTQYVTYNMVNSIDIAPGKGFFVQASTDGFVNFYSANQYHENTNTSSRESLTNNFELFVTKNNSTASTKVFYIDGKTTGFDNGYDSEIFTGTTTDFAVYTELVSENEGAKLAIQTLPIDNAIAIPVGLIAAAGEEITFSVENLNLPQGSALYLENKSTGEFVDLTETNYNITLENNVNEVGQFYIHTTAKSLSTTETNLDIISIYKSSKNQLTISGLTRETNIRVFSLLGKEVLTTTVNGNSNKVALPSLSTGIYIVKATSNLGEVTKKIVLE